MQLVLVVPGLLALDAKRLAATRSLAALAQFAGHAKREPRGIAAALFATLGMSRDTAAAPLALLGAQGDPGDDYVLFADPVHLAPDRDTVALLQAIDDLADDDERALIQMLDRHFADDGLTFEAPRTNAWFARSQKSYDIATTPLDVAMRRSIFSYLPQGPDARRWRTWQNEVQMLLHEHPANAAREARSEPAVTGVWFWGAGRLGNSEAPPPVSAAAAPSRIADVACGIARLARGEAIALHGDAGLGQATAALESAGRHADGFVVLVAPSAMELATLESKWLEPALSRLARRDIERLHVIANGDGAAATWTASAPSVWRRIAARAARHRFDVPPSP